MNVGDHLIESNLGKWNRDTMVKDKVPKEIISTFYDKNDNVLFGSCMTKGLVSYNYLEGKFSTDGNPIYLNCSILYDGKGNECCPDKSRIRKFDEIKEYIEGLNKA